MTTQPYFIRNPFSGINERHTTMFSRADMAFYGFSSRDVIPPKDMTLTFPQPHCEPVFSSKDS